MKVERYFVKKNKVWRPNRAIYIQIVSDVHRHYNKPMNFRKKKEMSDIYQSIN